MIKRLRDQAVALALFGAASMLSAGAHAAEHGGGGMPQLNIPDFTPQLVWLALPRVAATMEERRQRREGDLARAAQLKSEAEAASAAYQRTLAEARAQAQSTIKETSDRLAADAAERQRALAATLAEQIAAAERRIASTKQEALAEVRGIAVDVGRSVVEKLTGAAPDAAKMAAAVDSSLSGRAP